MKASRKDRIMGRYLSEDDCDRYAWRASISLHLLLFVIFMLFTLTFIKDPVVEQYRVPVQMIVHEEAPIPPKKAKPKAESKSLVSKKALPNAKTVVAKPTRLPGDRRFPIVSKFVPPVYPKTALNNQWQGTVKLKVLITGKGFVKSVKLIKSSGHPILDQSFMRTVKQYYQFKPKRVMGENKEASKIVQYTFKLES